MTVKNFMLNDSWVRLKKLNTGAPFFSFFALRDRSDDLLNRNEGEVAARSRRIARAVAA